MVEWTDFFYLTFAGLFVPTTQPNDWPSAPFLPGSGGHLDRAPSLPSVDGCTLILGRLLSFLPRATPADQILLMTLTGAAKADSLQGTPPLTLPAPVALRAHSGSQWSPVVPGLLSPLRDIRSACGGRGQRPPPPSLSL